MGMSLGVFSRAVSTANEKSTHDRIPGFWKRKDFTSSGSAGFFINLALEVRDSVKILPGMIKLAEKKGVGSMSHFVTVCTMQYRRVLATCDSPWAPTPINT